MTVLFQITSGKRSIALDFLKCPSFRSVRSLFESKGFVVSGSDLQQNITLFFM